MSLTKNPKEILEVHQEKLKKIKCALFDVDGILTDGDVFTQARKWDGIGTSIYMMVMDSRDLWLRFHVGIISGGDSRGLNREIYQ